MKSEKEIQAAFASLYDERAKIQVAMNKDGIELLKYSNLQAQEAALSIEIRLLSWVMSE
jgi:hypothetical protein